MAVTPATNVACMKYNGGGDAETICVIDLGNPEAIKAKPTQKPLTVSGISSFHYMEADPDGVRVWQVAGIGPGRLIPWNEVKKHFRGKEVVDPCVPLVDVDAAVDAHRAGNADAVPSSKEMKGKIHRTHVNVKRRKKMKQLKVKEKRDQRAFNYQKSVEEFSRRIEEEKRHRCKWCSKVMATVESLTKHQKDGCTSKKGKIAAAAATTVETITSSNEGEWVYLPQLHCCY